MAHAEDWLAIGKIVSAQGLKGELRVYPDTDFPERFLEPGERWLQGTDGAAPRSVQLLRGRFLSGKGLYVVTLAGVESRVQAEALCNSRLLVPASDRLPLNDDEFHVADLLGLTVFDQSQQQTIGTIVDIIQAGNDLLEVKPLATLSEEAAAQSAEDTAEATENVAPEPPPQPAAPQRGRNPRGKKPKRVRSQPKTWLIPFVKAIVPVVDLQQGRIEIDPPEGLLD